MNIEKVSNSQLLQRAGNTERSDINQLKPQMQAMKEEITKIQNENNLSKERVIEIVDGLNNFLEPINKSIKFEFHDKLEKYYVSIVNKDTDELIKEIPPKKILDVYAAIAEYMGLIVDERI